MKRLSFLSVVCSVLLIGLFESCATTETGTGGLYKPVSVSENDTLEIIGSVQVNFTGNTSMMNGSPLPANKEVAYIQLLSEAKKTYQRNDVDIRNISVVNQKSGYWKDVPLLATGDVVVRTSNGRNSATNATGVEGALARAAEQTLKNVPQKSKIAIVYITAQDRSTTEYVVGELEYIWVNQGYFITDRSQLDRLRREQNFQMSGEVDDDTAVSIGRFAGASIIVTGRVDGEGNLRRLRLRALDTQTAQVVGVASEKL
jgi:hypothetical protein